MISGTKAREQAQKQADHIAAQNERELKLEVTVQFEKLCTLAEEAVQTAIDNGEMVAHFQYTHKPGPIHKETVSRFMDWIVKEHGYTQCHHDQWHPNDTIGYCHDFKIHF